MLVYVWANYLLLKSWENGFMLQILRLWMLKVEEWMNKMPMFNLIYQ